MKKVIIGMSLLTGLFFGSFAIADDFSGLRLGGGYSNTSAKVNTDTGNYDLDGKGLKIEAGYDFSPIVGLGISYEMVNDTLDNIVNDRDEDGYSIKIGTDLGYAFYSNNVFFKPYGKLGLAHYSEDDFDGTSLFAGLGFRYQYKNIYADVGADCYFIDGEADVDYVKFVQSSFTIGYKF